MFSVIGWIIFGLVIGVLARWIMPGNDNMNLFETCVLGVIGSFAGGSVSFLLGDGGAVVQSAGFGMSLVGALLVLWGYNYYKRISDIAMWLKFGKLWVTLGKFLAYRKTKATISDIAAKVLNDSKRQDRTYICCP